MEEKKTPSYPGNEGESPYPGSQGLIPNGNREGKKLFYNQYPYSIFDQTILSNYYQNQKILIAQQHSLEQQKNILELRKAIADYCNAARKITEDYRDQAMKECLEEILLQAAKDGLC